MPTPFVPGRKSCRCTIDRFAAVELPNRRDAHDGSPLREFRVGHVPRRRRLLGLPLVQSSPLLGRRKFEVAHLYRRTEVGCCLS